MPALVYIALKAFLVLHFVLIAAGDAQRRALEETRALPVELSDAAAARVIGAHLRAVESCWLLEERAGLAVAGKLSLALSIAPSGAVTDVRFEGRPLGSLRFYECVRTQARTWTFPRFRRGEKRFAFPVVFVARRSERSAE